MRSHLHPTTHADRPTKDTGDNDDAQDATRLARAVERFRHGSPSGEEEGVENSHPDGGRGGGCTGDSGEEEKDFSLKQGMELACADGDEDEVEVAALVRILKGHKAEQKFLETTG